MVLSLHKKRRFLGLLMTACILSAVFGFGLHLLKRYYYPQTYSDFVERYCAEYGIEPNLAYAVIHTESGFDSNAISHLGACGLMQLMPDTFDWLRSKHQDGSAEEDIFDPETNIRYGVYFLSLLQAEFHDERLAIAAYHAGMGRVNQWLNDAVLSPDGKTLTSIPFSDTEYYVKKVERTKRIYETLYVSANADATNVGVVCPGLWRQYQFFSAEYVK